MSFSSLGPEIGWLGFSKLEAVKNFGLGYYDAFCTLYSLVQVDPSPRAYLCNAVEEKTPKKNRVLNSKNICKELGYVCLEEM